MLHLPLRVDTSDPRPIGRQIEEGIQHLVTSGSLSPGEPIPSVRDLARDLRVNPNTVAKAFQRLGEAGVLEMRRGDGTYVAQNPPLPSAAERQARLADAAARFAATAAGLGFDAKPAAVAVLAAFLSLESKEKKS
ncbi:MAG: GntR family transcriptional regulator [Thermoanaerobaculia bacterium]|nr:GntR family transcriptional regulator [Thermoanaerobaculia bacterium]